MALQEASHRVNWRVIGTVRLQRFEAEVGQGDESCRLLLEVIAVRFSWVHTDERNDRGFKKSTVDKFLFAAVT